MKEGKGTCTKNKRKQRLLCSVGLAGWFCLFIQSPKVMGTEQQPLPVLSEPRKIFMWTDGIQGERRVKQSWGPRATRILRAHMNHVTRARNCQRICPCLFSICLCIQVMKQYDLRSNMRTYHNSCYLQEKPFGVQKLIKLNTTCFTQQFPALFVDVAVR